MRLNRVGWWVVLHDSAGDAGRPVKAARRWLDEVLSWDFDLLVMAHGPVLRTGVRTHVEQAFRWLA